MDSIVSKLWSTVNYDISMIKLLYLSNVWFIEILYIIVWDDKTIFQKTVPDKKFNTQLSWDIDLTSGIV